MKNTLTSLALAVSAFSATSALAHTDYVPADSSRETRLCMIVAEGTRVQFAVEVRNQQTTVRRIATNVTCNDINITAFAQQVGNEPIYQQLSRHFNPHVEIYRTASVNP